MKPTLAPGLTPEATLRVTDDLTVPRASPQFTTFAVMPRVFATAYMAGFVEAACIDCVRRHLDLGEHSVGTHVDVSHVAATPVGMEVSVRVRLTEVDRRALVFEVEASDVAGPIGEGTHRRAVIDIARFMAKIGEELDQRSGVFQSGVTA